MIEKEKEKNEKKRREKNKQERIKKAKELSEKWALLRATCEYLETKTSEEKKDTEEGKKSNKPESDRVWKTKTTESTKVENPGNFSKQDPYRACLEGASPMHGTPKRGVLHEGGPGGGAGARGPTQIRPQHAIRGIIDENKETEGTWGRVGLHFKREVQFRTHLFSYPF